MSWQAYILISVLFLSIGTLFQRIVMKEKEADPWSFSVVFQILVALLIYIYTLLTSGPVSLSLPIYHPNLILMTVLWAFANILIYNALKALQASTFAILFATRSLFTLVAATVFLDESVGAYQVLGIALILLGVTAVSVQRSGLSLGKPGLLAILAAACVGLANTNDRMVLKFLDVPTYSVVSYLFPGIFLLLLKPTAVKKLKDFRNSARLGKTIILALFWVGFGVTFNFALQLAPSAPQVTAMSTTSVVLTVLLSAIFLKERSNLGKKLVGAVLTAIGLTLVVK